MSRYKGSPAQHRVELYDGPDMIEFWSSEEGERYQLSSRLSGKL